MRRLILGLCPALLLAGCGQPDPESADIVHEAALGPAAQLTAACSGCHTGGGAIPHIQSHDKAGLVALLRSYRDDTAGTTVMHRLARGYSDTQIELIADYYTAAGVQP